ncbi:beta-ketoacyl-[acyl-carrier-protein] synthase family protein [Streptomyces luteireticuli]|uniref:Ketosynthase family 3 (KS3) domain-containing protein n=1 Tax=Streptomyces luteireticuli TaxID=173858 RepID=A0ABN0YNC3_9ACTN
MRANLHAPGGRCGARPTAVITGVGMVSALGSGVEESWGNLVAGRGGIVEADRIDLTGLSTGFAGQAPGLPAPEGGDRPDRAVELALAAAGEAVRRGRLAGAGYRPGRLGLVVSTSLGGTPTGETFHRAWLTDGLAAADPRPLSAYTLHACADAVATAHGLHGPRSVVSNACAAGGVAIGYALELLWGGDADAVLCGGVDPLSLVSFNGFNCLGALDEHPCAPYTRSQGLTLGEGSGFLLLEREDRARERGAELVAAALGYGLTADAHHPTAPDPGGAGAVRAMAVALAEAGHEPAEVDYVNGHGTGTPTNDVVEPKAIRGLFGTPPPVSSTKSLIGHTLGAAGAIEAVCCALAVQRGMLPPTLTDGPSPGDLDIVPDRGRPGPAALTLSNSFGFGGNNASVAIGAPARPRTVPARDEPARRVVVAGAAGLAGNAVDDAGLAAAFDTASPLYGGEPVTLDGFGPYPLGQPDLKAITRGINPAVLRRMDPLGRLAAAAVKQLHDRCGRPGRAEAERTALLFATGTGPISTVERFHRDVVLHGPSAADTRLFPNTVMNAAAGHVAVLHRFRGATATVSSGGTSMTGALHYAYRLVRRGAAERVLVLGADEAPDVLLAGYLKRRGYLGREGVRPFHGGGTVLSAGAVAVLVTSEAEAERSGLRPLAEITGFGLTGDSSGIAGIDRSGAAWADAFRTALDAAGIGPDEVDLVSAAAMGHVVADRAELSALRRAGLASRPVVASKSVVGDAGGTAPGLALLAALRAMDTGRLPGTWGVDTAPRTLPGLVPAAGREYGTVRHALVSGFAFGGSYQAMTVSRWPA